MKPSRARLVCGLVILIGASIACPIIAARFGYGRYIASARLSDQTAKGSQRLTDKRYVLEFVKGLTIAVETRNSRVSNFTTSEAETDGLSLGCVFFNRHRFPIIDPAAATDEHWTASRALAEYLETDEAFVDARRLGIHTNLLLTAASQLKAQIRDSSAH